MLPQGFVVFFSLNIFFLRNLVGYFYFRASVVIVRYTAVVKHLDFTFGPKFCVNKSKWFWFSKSDRKKQEKCFINGTSRKQREALKP